MRKRIAIAALAVLVGACGAPKETTRTPADGDAPAGILDTYEQANEVADQLNSREAELEQMVAEMGG